MKFYLARDAEGFRRLLTVQTEAKAMDKSFAELEIGTDKPSLQAALQELLTEADMANRGSADAEPGEALDTELAGIPVTVRETENGVVMGLASTHDPRCPKCHRMLTSTEDGAYALANGEDMTIIQQMIESSPTWFRTGLEQAIAQCKADEWLAQHETVSETEAVSLEPNEVSGT